jgi:Ribonuclease G/E
MYEALGVRDIDKILKPKEEVEARPKDPATENIDALNQLELQAFEGQNHDAHIMSHLVFGASGLVAQMPMVAMALQKHLMDHVRIKATEAVMAQASQLGPIDQLPEEVVVQLEGAVAAQIAQELQALRQLNDQVTGQGQQGPDPLVALKEQELQLRAQKDQAEIAQDQAELELDRQKAAERAREFQARLDQNAQLTMTKLQATAERERSRIAAQLAMAQQRRQ